MANTGVMGSGPPILVAGYNVLYNRPQPLDINYCLKPASAVHLAAAVGYKLLSPAAAADHMRHLAQPDPE